MEVALVSDMHIPGQKDRIPDAFRERIEAADHVIHAGDFGSKEALSEVKARAADLTAVYGNADPGDIDLPAVASVTIEGVTFVVLHGIVNPIERAVSSSEGVVMNRDDWLDAIAETTRARADEPIVGVGGHTHEVEDTVHDGIRLLNPGSATGVGPDVDATMMAIEITDGELDVTLHEA